MPFHLYLSCSANNIYQSVCTRGYGFRSWLWLLKPKLGKAGPLSTPNSCWSPLDQVALWNTFPLTGRMFTAVPLSWGTLCIMLIHSGANINHCSLLWMLCEKNWILLQITFLHVILCYRISFLTFQFLYIKICVRYSDLFPCLQRFESEFFALEFININMLKCCLLPQVW